MIGNARDGVVRDEVDFGQGIEAQGFEHLVELFGLFRPVVLIFEEDVFDRELRAVLLLVEQAFRISRTGNLEDLGMIFLRKGSVGACRDRARFTFNPSSAIFSI